MAQEPPKVSSEDALKSMGGGDDPAVQAARLEQLSKTTPPAAKDPLSDSAIAAALAAETAGRKDLAHEDALSALANGEAVGDDAPPQTADEAQAPADAPDIYALGGEPVAEESAVRSGGTSARIRSAERAEKMRRAHAHTFKKTMIVPMLAVGLLLLLMGTAVAVMMISGSLPTVESKDFLTSLLHGRYRIFLVMLALPLGAVLILCAWMFHREIKSYEG
ncbi:MAG: hypothetical protein ACE15C_04720 [Phycisphaerae bacterium]